MSTPARRRDPAAPRRRPACSPDALTLIRAFLPRNAATAAVSTARISGVNSASTGASEPTGAGATADVTGAGATGAGGGGGRCVAAAIRPRQDPSPSADNRTRRHRSRGDTRYQCDQEGSHSWPLRAESVRASSAAAAPVWYAALRAPALDSGACRPVR